MAPLKQNYPSVEQFTKAADKLQCSVSAIQAVAEVEAGPHGAFLPTGEPVILFERHYFSRITNGKYDGWKVPNGSSWALISDPKPGGYGPLAAQHERLALAATLDRKAALKSCSWGLFQIMGANYHACGHASIQSFVNSMYRDVYCHLQAFVSFILSDHNLLIALRSGNWSGFSIIYNGPQFKKNKYHTRIAEAYERFREAEQA